MMAPPQYTYWMRTIGRGKCEKVRPFDLGIFDEEWTNTYVESSIDIGRFIRSSLWLKFPDGFSLKTQANFRNSRLFVENVKWLKYSIVSRNGGKFKGLNTWRFYEWSLVSTMVSNSPILYLIDWHPRNEFDEY